MSEQDRKQQEIDSRVILVYSSSLSFLGIVATGGLAANGAILQLAEKASIELVCSSLALLISLFLAFIALSCLVGQAGRKIPNFKNKWLVGSGSGSVLLLVVGIGLLFFGMIGNTSKPEKTCPSCFCHSPVSIGLESSKSTNSCEK